MAGRGATVTETGSRRGGGRDGGGAQGRSFENGCPAPPKRSPGYREKQASSSGLGLSRNRKLQKTDYPGQKKKERSLWDLLDSLGQNDAQLRVKLVMNVGLKLEITKNKPRGIHRQRGRQKSRMQLARGTKTQPPVGRGPRVPGAAGSPRTASCSDVTDGTGTRAPTLVGGGKAPENATWHSACEGGGFRRARGAEGRGLMAGGGRSTSEQDLL